MLAEFGHPEIDPDTRVSRLPIAARQVVEICRAITGRARVVLMDEPTSSLQRADVDRLFTLIGRLAGQGVAVVYISHFLEEAREVAGAFTVLRDGRTVASGALEPVTNDELIAHMVGRSVDTRFPRRARGPAEGLGLEVRGLAAGPAVREASFALRRGEVLGVFGLMGSGRTEMVRALFGLDPADAGTVARGGREEPARSSPTRRLRQGLGYLSEDRKGEGLALPLSVADNVTLTRLESCVRHGVLDIRKQQAQANERAAGAQGEDAGGRAAGAHPVRRQPAEGGPRSPAPPGRRRPAPRRAHPGNRRGEQGPDLRGHRGGGLPGQGGADGRARTCRSSSGSATGSRS